MKVSPVKRGKKGRSPSQKDTTLPSRKLLLQQQPDKATPETPASQAQAIVERLQRALADIHNLPVLTGDLGCQFLDSLELIDKIRAQYREKVRQWLLREPRTIPGWHVSETPQRTLSKDTARVFEALSREDDSLTRERFLESCSISLTAVRKLLEERNPQLNPTEVEYEINHALAELIHYESVVRLSRSKERKLTLSLP